MERGVFVIPPRRDPAVGFAEIHKIRVRQAGCPAAFDMTNKTVYFEHKPLTISNIIHNSR
jgi:hypothetical protein